MKFKRISFPIISVLNSQRAKLVISLHKIQIYDLFQTDVISIFQNILNTSNTSTIDVQDQMFSLVSVIV